MTPDVRPPEAKAAATAHVLPPLPYALDALAPHITKRTLEFHYGKHHAGYVAKLNQLIPGTEFAHLSLEETIRMASAGPILNNAAQIWNHTFYWNGLGPRAGTRPGAKLAAAIDRAFGSFDGFTAEFTRRATAIFGSGWAWLTRKPDGSLALEETGNADTPLRHGRVALLTCDVWEHAYYLDYQNDRARYLAEFWNVVNWEAVTRRYDAGG
jgi:Fe-Mn family superoxide dismutase